MALVGPQRHRKKKSQFLNKCHLSLTHLKPNSLINLMPGILTFTFPCIVSIIIIDNQQDATILIYLFLISSTSFGSASSNIGGQYQKL